MRKALFVYTGGLSGAAGVKANSKKDRTAKASEQLVRLQKQQMRAGAQARPAPAAAAPAAAITRTGVVVQPGPRDPWLNEVAGVLKFVGFAEHARNTETYFLSNVPLEGNIEFIGPWAKLSISIFESEELARQGEVAFRATPEIGNAIATRRTVIRNLGQLICWANGQGSTLEPSYLDEVVKVLGQIGLPPPLAKPGLPAVAAPVGMLAETNESPIEKIRKLGELRDAGVLTQDEFQTKKAELLERV